MKNLGFVLLFAVGCGFATASWADDLVKDAAIGGAIGGALGGAVGAEVGGKNGAIVGAGVGAAAGAAIATDDDHDGTRRRSPRGCSGSRCRTTRAVARSLLSSGASQEGSLLIDLERMRRLA